MAEQDKEKKKKKGTRRRPGEGTVYQRKDKRWVAEITLEDGNRKQYYFKNEADAVAKKNQLLYEMKLGTLATGPQQKFKDYLVRWFEEVQKPDLRETSIERYENCIYKHILPALGHIQLQKLTAQQIQSFYNSKRKAGYAPESVITLHKVIHKALDNAVRWRLISRNVSDDVTLPKQVSLKEPQALTVEQARHLLSAAKGHELEAMIVLLLDTGCVMEKSHQSDGTISTLRREPCIFIGQ